MLILAYSLKVRRAFVLASEEILEGPHPVLQVVQLLTDFSLHEASVINQFPRVADDVYRVGNVQTLSFQVEQQVTLPN